MPAHQPIAVFDSGLGGLTVVRALRELLPHESIIYLGDTARVPYGTKSPQTVLRFTRECLRFLGTLDPKLMVVACNTASALALPHMQGEWPVPVVGVLEPGARAAVAAAHAQGVRQVGLIATEATVNSMAYPQAIARLDPRMQVMQRACPLLVPMIEEGRLDTDPIVGLVLREYLQPFSAMHLAAIILGCTHYPMLTGALGRLLGPNVALVDSAQETARQVARELAELGQLAPTHDDESGSLTCYVTDQGQRFGLLATRFLGQPVGQPVWVAPETLEQAGAS